MSTRVARQGRELPKFSNVGFHFILTSDRVLLVVRPLEKEVEIHTKFFIGPYGQESAEEGKGRSAELVPIIMSCLWGLYPSRRPAPTSTTSYAATAAMPQFSRQIISLSKSALQARAAPDQACLVLFFLFLLSSEPDEMCIGWPLDRKRPHSI